MLQIYHRRVEKGGGGTQVVMNMYSLVGSNRQTQFTFTYHNNNIVKSALPLGTSVADPVHFVLSDPSQTL